MSIDDFLIDVSLILGVSQHTVETEYYMVDLPRILEQKMKIDSVKKLEDLRFHIATNNRALDQVDFKKYTGELVKRTGAKGDDKFDRDKFEQLRLMAKGVG